MKKLYIKISIIIITITGLASCSDDFVNVDSNDVNSEDFFNSEEDYQNALIGAYDLLQSTYINVMLGEIASDNTLAGGESATDVIGIQEIDDMIHTPVNSNLRDLWGWMYGGVNRANFILEFQDKIDFSGKDQVIAQARFLRAYYYFELVKWFGDIPLAIDKQILFGEESSYERSPASEVYSLIEQDLIYAADKLPSVPAETGRVTKGAAQALLGKAYLYQDKFSEAAQELETLIQSGTYSLVTDYNTIFEEEGENNIESVFEVQYTDLEGAGFGCLQCSEGNVAVGFSGVRNYEGPDFTSGFSFNVPVQEAYDAFDNDDPRRDIAILDINAWAASTGATFGTGYEHTGYFNRKYIPRIRSDQALADLNLTNPNNYRAIRYADVLLMAAEANNRMATPNDVKALQYLNRVRDRAFGDILHRSTATGTALKTAIWDERRLELGMEGHRFFDLVRTGQAASKITGWIANKNEVFPIPQAEVDISGLTQNPGYN